MTPSPPGTPLQPRTTGRQPHLTGQPSTALEFAPLPTASACARLHTAAVFREWGMSRDLINDAETVVSELVANATHASAMLPGRPPVGLRLTATRPAGGGTAALIEVWDHSPLDPELRDPAEDDEAGRGLTIVAALSTRWGYERTGYQRKVVWSELAGPRDG